MYQDDNVYQQLDLHLGVAPWSPPLCKEEKPLTASQGPPQDKAETDSGEQYANRAKKAGRWRFASTELCETGVGAPLVVWPAPKLKPKRGTGAGAA